MSASIEPGDAVEPDAMPTYVWEPTTDFLAAKYGLPRESIVRFDVNTSPLPPDLRDVLTGPFDPVLSEYPPSDYAALVDAAAAAYGVFHLERFDRGRRAAKGEGDAREI